MSQKTDLPGIVQRFQPGDYEFVEDSIRSLTEMGVRWVRTSISLTDYQTNGGREWFDWLLERLGSQFDLLPCLTVASSLLADQGSDIRRFVDAIVAVHGDHFNVVELWDWPDGCDRGIDPDWMTFCSVTEAAAERLRLLGKRVVLGAASIDLNWLRLLGERGLLNVVDAVGFRGSLESVDPVAGGAWEDVRETVQAYNPELELWITETGYSTWREDPFRQVEAFLKAVDAPVDRVYWHGLRDLPGRDGVNSDVRHCHFGLQHADGRPKMLGRLLIQGLPAVRNLASLNRSVAVVGRKPPVLITGGAGFIGSALADRLAKEGESVLIYDSFARPGVEGNVAWLRERHPRRVSCAVGDIRDKAALGDAVRDCAAVFHLAAQVAVTTSMANPTEDMSVNLLGTFNLLEALRQKRQPCIFASTNKVYGAMEDVNLVCIDDAWQPADATMRQHGCDEAQRLDFRTPYGCSKGAADQYMLDFTRSFHVPTAVMRMSCIYGPRQLGTEDQGWVAHFILRALAGQPITIYGDGRQVRDILFVDDAVNAYVAAWRNIGRVSGQAFNLGGGPENAISLVQLINAIRQLTEHPVDVGFAAWRPNDQRYYVSDTRKVRAALALSRPRDWRSGVKALVEAFSGRAVMSESASRVVA